MKLIRVAAAVCALGVVLPMSPAATAQPALDQPADATGTDEFQRRIVFYNDLPYTVWPVIQAPQDANCLNLFSTSHAQGGKGWILLRIHVNSVERDRGIPPNESVVVTIPKTITGPNSTGQTVTCDVGAFYAAVRIPVLVAKAKDFESVLQKQLQFNTVTTDGTDTLKGTNWWKRYDHAKLPTQICGGTDPDTDPCWIGWAEAAYPLDAPTQLLEYTIISQNAKGDANPNPNDSSAGSRSFLDFDVSYVDEAYLPAAMAPDTGATQFMGSRLGFTDFQTGLQNFHTQAPWPLWATFSEVNFKSPVPPGTQTAFASLLTGGNPQNIGGSPRIPSGAMVVENSRLGSGSPFYTPSWDGTTSKQCKDPSKKDNLLCAVALPNNDLCCPDANAMQGCCDQFNAIIEGVKGTYAPIPSDQFRKRFSGESLRDLTNRWTKWALNQINCEAQPPDSPAPDPLQFCKDFKRTARFVWNVFAERDKTGAKICFPSNSLSDLRDDSTRNECLTALVVGYQLDKVKAAEFNGQCKAPGSQDCPNGKCCPDCPAFCTDEKQLNESVQALLRGVPWNANGDPATCALCPSSNPAECPADQCVWVGPDRVSPDARLYHFDGFLHFWAPSDSVYNLNPYARLIHVPGTRKWVGSPPAGLDAPGAYSFSIDDFYGNFGGPGSTLLVQIGGSSRMPNPEPYDPYRQYFVTVGSGWATLDICGRLVNIPQVNGAGVDFATPFSFYTPRGERTDPCVITVTDGAGLFATYRLSEVTYPIDDAYIAANNKIVARSQTVKGLSGVSAVRKAGDPVPFDAFCNTGGNHTAPASKCTGNLSPVGRGNRDAYNGLPDNCDDTPAGRLDATCGRPLVKFSVPARKPD